MIILDGYNGGGTDFYDNFNRANGEIGNGWTDGNTGATDPVINSNVVRYQLPNANTPTPIGEIRRTPSFSDIYIVSFDFNFVSYTLQPYISFSPNGTRGSTGVFQINKNSIAASSEIIINYAGVGSASTTKTINDNTWYTVKAYLRNYGLIGGMNQADWKLKVWERGTPEPGWDLEENLQPQGAIFERLFIDVGLWNFETTDPDVIVDIDNFHLFTE